MLKISFETLAKSRNVFESMLVEFDLKIKPNSWLYRAYDRVEELTSVYKNNTARREFFNKKNKNGEVFFSLYDVEVIHEILPFLREEKNRILGEKLRKILQMSSPPLENIKNNEARNTLWELSFLSRLRRVNVQASLGDPNPDILAQFGIRKYYIQCKRLYSPKASALQRNIIKAVRQLESDLASEDNNSLGIMAFSIERPFTKGKYMLVTDSEQIGKEKLVVTLETFRSQFGHLWQDPSLIKDPRIVAIVIHLITPGIVEEENIFVIGSQVVVNNTWADGQGFQFVQEDFGSLKEILGY